MGNTALLATVVQGEAMIVQLLINAGSDVNRVNQDGWTPLVCASLFGHLDVVKLLVEASANTEFTYNLLTAEEWANQRGHTGIVGFLNSQ